MNVVVGLPVPVPVLNRDLSLQRRENQIMSTYNNNNALPMVFQTENLSYEDRYWAYQSKILGDCTVDQVPVRIKKYVAQQIEPGRWKAIWRGKNDDQNFDVVVEVSTRLMWCNALTLKIS